VTDSVFLQGFRGTAGIARAVLVAAFVGAWLLGQAAGGLHRVAHGLEPEHARDHALAHALHAEAPHADTARADADHDDSFAEHGPGGSVCKLLDQLGLADALPAHGVLPATVPSPIDRWARAQAVDPGRTIGSYQARGPPAAAA
jgi:hypothetical protein